MHRGCARRARSDCGESGLGTQPASAGTMKPGPLRHRVIGVLSSLEEAPWRPAADVLLTRGGWVVKVDLAGVAPEDLSVAIEGSLLRISGVRRDAHAAESLDHFHMEIRYSVFERTFAIPCDLGRCNLASEYRDGMLVVLLETKE